MKILIINTGSSSIKYQLFDMVTKVSLAQGLLEKLEESESRLKQTIHTGSQIELKKSNLDHSSGMLLMLNALMHKEKGVISSANEIQAVGHRVVHGGEDFTQPVIIDDEVIASIKKCVPLAPLHNPANLIGMDVARSIFKTAFQVAVFDTAFHQSIKPHAYLYALPYELYRNARVRRYGFHGSSHKYVVAQAASYLNKPIEEAKLITLHLGNGASASAVDGGNCVDTSMGLTPLEGLVMGTRSGDIDPAIPFYLACELNMSLDEIDTLLNKKSGLKGLCGKNDLREIAKMVESGDNLAKLALEIYCYRIKKYIGSYYASLNGADAIIFTAGVGENSKLVRLTSCANLSALGIEVDEAKNNSLNKEGISEIQTEKSKVKILVIPTNEELQIASETFELVK